MSLILTIRQETPPSPPSDLTNNVGAIMIGSMVGLVLVSTHLAGTLNGSDADFFTLSLYGMAVQQTIYYLRTYTKDDLTIKTWVRMFIVQGCENNYDSFRGI